MTTPFSVATSTSASSFTVTPGLTTESPPQSYVRSARGSVDVDVLHQRVHELEAPAPVVLRPGRPPLAVILDHDRHLAVHELRIEADVASVPPDRVLDGVRARLVDRDEDVENLLFGGAVTLQPGADAPSHRRQLLGACGKAQREMRSRNRFEVNCHECQIVGVVGPL